MAAQLQNEICATIGRRFCLHMVHELYRTEKVQISDTNFSIKKMHLKLSSAKCWSYLSGLDVLSTIPVQPTDFCKYFSFCPVAHTYINLSSSATQIARFMGPTWDPPGANRTQAGSMWATWTLLSGNAQILIGNNVMQPYLNMKTNYRTDKPTQTSIAYKRASTCT